jgi:GH15 family glucan-1,4-alpha-glucosidase
MKNAKPTYQPIEDYGVIGNLHTVALVGLDGSIDWCCMPHFDSPSVFGALLDAAKGGRFKITTVKESTHKQFYIPDSNILVTRFMNPDGTGEIIDFMPVAKNPKDDASSHYLYRIVRVVRGEMTFQCECHPAFDYGRAEHKVARRNGGFLFDGDGMNLWLQAEVPLDIREAGVEGEFTLHEGQSTAFILSHIEEGCEAKEARVLPWQDAFQQTNDYWKRWTSRIQYRGRWREAVTRSALALKLMTYAPTGAIVAAPTTSLPEIMGGKKNWDYRFTWIRDASFTLYGLLRLGYSEEAGDFMEWLHQRLSELNSDGSLNIMYGLHGEHELTEMTLDHWEGYKGSKPVRIGNGAHGQLQLDIYGELMDSVYLYNKYGSPISYDMWVNMRKLLGYVCSNWKREDKGIWEGRGVPRHFTYSKVMCWVALDRGLRLAEKRSLPADWELWTKTRDEIYQEVMARSWNPELQSFTQYYDGDTVDAATLIMPLVKFISPTDPKMLGTLKRIKERLVTDSLVHRYERTEEIKRLYHGLEGTFSMCTFWYVEALARAGQVGEARWIFDKMMGYANHVGLFAEEVGLSGEQLGNFPQAFTHLALISAAWNLDKALNEPNSSGHSDTFSIFGGAETEEKPEAKETSAAQK